MKVRDDKLYAAFLCGTPHARCKPIEQVSHGLKRVVVVKMSIGMGLAPFSPVHSSP
jgi:hypothetical protein